MRFVRIKSAEQQGQLMQRRTRDVLIRQRAQSTPCGTHLAELGFVAAQGNAGQRIARARDGRSWKKPRRVVAKVEWHPGELYPRVGFIVTNLSRPAERVVASTTSAGRASNGRKGAIKWTRLSCCSLAANAAPRRLVSDHCIVRHGRYVIFQIRSAEGIVPRDQTLALPEAIKSSASGAGLQSRQLHADRSSAISRRIWRGGDCGLREKPDGHVFKGDRWEECVQMPRKMA